MLVELAGLGGGGEGMSGVAERPVAELLAELYARVPDAGCRGLCSGFCEPVVMSPAERDLLAEASGVTLPVVPATTSGACPVLTDGGRCGGYRARPMVCRVWGAAEAMACPHGCRPASAELLGDRELLELMLDSFTVGGGPWPAEQITAMRHLSARPDLLPVLAAILRAPGGKPSS
ncbi:hypothetical protein [Longispora albida]|uniref:hypothetical protein n=1 Tax=Longispora albida TaxID=203523 RepID=UPI0012FAA23A|nr:hypothetical protein [Longispora albida]